MKQQPQQPQQQQQPQQLQQQQAYPAMPQQQQAYPAMPQQQAYPSMPQQQAYPSMPQQQAYPIMPQQPVYAGVPQQQAVPALVPVMAGTGPRIWPTFANSSAKFLGSSQIVIGILCMVFTIAGITMDVTASVSGHGIWSGIFFIIAGMFGLSSSSTKTTCHIVTFLVMSIIAATLTLPLLILASIGLGLDNTGYHYMQNKGERIAIGSVLVLLSLCESIVSIWSAAICCSAVCCCRRTTPPTYASAGVQQYVTVGGGQQLMIVSSPLAPAPLQPTVVAPPGVAVATQPVMAPSAPPTYSCEGAPPKYSVAG